MEESFTPVANERTSRVLRPTDPSNFHPATTTKPFEISATAFAALFDEEVHCHVHCVVPVEEILTAKALVVPSPAEAAALPTKIWDPSDVVMPWTAWGSSRDGDVCQESVSGLKPLYRDAMGAESRLMDLTG